MEPCPEQRRPEPIGAVAAVLAAGSWFAPLLFLLEVTSLQLGWWRAPWGAAGHQGLLLAGAGLGAFYTLVYAAMTWRRRGCWSSLRDPRDRVRYLIDALHSVTCAGIAIWCGSALRGHLTLLPVYLVVLAELAWPVGAYLLLRRAIGLRAS